MPRTHIRQTHTQPICHRLMTVIYITPTHTCVTTNTYMCDPIPNIFSFSTILENFFVDDFQLLQRVSRVHIYIHSCAHFRHCLYTRMLCCSVLQCVAVCAYTLVYTCIHIFSFETFLQMISMTSSTCCECVYICIYIYIHIYIYIPICVHF